MLKIVDVIEVRACGVFKDPILAKRFNQNVGGVLHLHHLRTTLNLAEFKTKFFQLDVEGAYLEKCCGNGNVKIKITNRCSAQSRDVQAGIQSGKNTLNLLKKLITAKFGI